MMNGNWKQLLVMFSVVFGFSGNVEGASVILNEYNAVGSSKSLDDDGTDSTLGQIEGNGGNWFELAVLGDGTEGSTVDMRNWTLEWEEDGDAGVISLSNDSFWSAVRAGTLITIGELETVTAESGDTVVDGSDVGVDFLTGDHWAHLYSFDTTYISGTTTNVSGDSSGNFSVGNDDWHLTIKNGGTVVFGPVGEGIVGGKVNSKEVYKLEEDPSTSVTPMSAYEDGSSSSFGAPNLWSGGANQQDFSAFGVVVPEPSSVVLLSLAMSSLLGFGSRRQR